MKKLLEYINNNMFSLIIFSSLIYVIVEGLNTAVYNLEGGIRSFIYSIVAISRGCIFSWLEFLFSFYFIGIVLRSLEDGVVTIGEWVSMVAAGLILVSITAAIFFLQGININFYKFGRDPFTDWAVLNEPDKILALAIIPVSILFTFVSIPIRLSELAKSDKEKKEKEIEKPKK